jgi:hypothetical protein
MTYIRTEEIRKKQSEKMKQVSKNMDYRKIVEKSKATLLEKGIKSGRKAYPTIEKICQQCKINFIVKDTKNRRTAKYCNPNCYHESKKGKILPYLVCNDRSYMQTEAYSLAKSKLDTPEYTRYKNKVYKLSEQTYAKYKDKINPNGYPRTLCGVEDGWQLDHIKSVRQCFDEKILPEHASNLNNLVMLPWKENLLKGDKRINSDCNF